MGANQSPALIGGESPALIGGERPVRFGAPKWISGRSIAASSRAATRLTSDIPPPQRVSLKAAIAAFASASTELKNSRMSPHTGDREFRHEMDARGCAWCPPSLARSFG